MASADRKGFARPGTEAPTDRAQLQFQLTLVRDDANKGSGTVRTPSRHGFTRLSRQARAAAPEKEKVSVTLDKPLVDELRAQSGRRTLSASINELLHTALGQQHLAELVDEMEQETGPASPAAYERVLAQWFDEN